MNTFFVWEINFTRPFSSQQFMYTSVQCEKTGGVGTRISLSRHNRPPSGIRHKNRGMTRWWHGALDTMSLDKQPAPLFLIFMKPFLEVNVLGSINMIIDMIVFPLVARTSTQVRVSFSWTNPSVRNSNITEVCRNSYSTPHQTERNVSL